jgi:hypothetical protein
VPSIAFAFLSAWFCASQAIFISCWIGFVPSVNEHHPLLSPPFGVNVNSLIGLGVRRSQHAQYDSNKYAFFSLWRFKMLLEISLSLGSVNLWSEVEGASGFSEREIEMTLGRQKVMQFFNCFVFIIKRVLLRCAPLSYIYSSYPYRCRNL